MSDIWFTSDTHFNHPKIIEPDYSDRPFDSIESMTYAIITNWNNCVSPGDDVYHLGDFALSWGKKSEKEIRRIFEQLNGHKHLIIGNHDRKEVTNLPWATVSHYKEIKVNLGREHKQRIVLSHYALRVWNQMHRGAWMLHGHSHGNLSDIGGKIMDVGVDTSHYAPLNIDDVDMLMSSRDVITYDHHEIRKPEDT